MRKLMLFVFLTAGIISCSKEIIETVEDTPTAVPMSFNITVVEKPDTRAAKTGWADGDVIYVFFKGLESKYLTLSFDGSNWSNASAGGVLTNEDFSGLSTLTLTAVHFPMPVDVAYDNGAFAFTKDGQPVYNYYLFDSDKAYEVLGSTVRGSLNMSKPENFIQIHIADIQSNVNDYSFGCSLIKPVACASVGTDGKITETTLSNGGRLKGVADSDGAIFGGRLATTSAADYTFTLFDDDNIYILKRVNKQLTPGKMYNFPAITVTGGNNWITGLWVDLGLSVKWASINLGATSPEQGGDYFAWGETEPKYLDGYALENPCTHWKPGQTGGSDGGYNNANYKFMQEGQSSWFKITKYTTLDYEYNGIWYDSDKNFIGDGKTTFADYDYEDDPVWMNWGGECRVATIDEWRELLSTSNCEWTWTEDYNGAGVKGWIVASKVSGFEGASIFLPAGGWRDGSRLQYTENGHYWTNSIETYTTKDSRYGQKLLFTSSSHYINSSARTNGLLVRPVME
ncbi:MAG: hypothetical protein K6F06_00005 [Bacteroidales bacterium]|nr:hypothetical protein [Bacteroidales bacterium]